MVEFEPSKVIKRLEIIKNYLSLEDKEEIHAEIRKLLPFEDYYNLKEIISLIDNEKYASALVKINFFLNQFQQVSLWLDPEIGALKMEIKKQQVKLEYFEVEKLELEKQLFDFHIQITKELGVIILEILKIKKLRKAKKLNHVFDENYKNDDDEYDTYKSKFEADKLKIIFELNEDEKVELKRMFRKASLMCHPDKVEVDKVEFAKQLFIDLKEAYETNNLNRIKQIHQTLVEGNLTFTNFDFYNEKQKLVDILAHLKQKIIDRGNEIHQLKLSEAYITLKSVMNWDVYFKNKKILLQDELDYLKEITLYQSY